MLPWLLQNKLRQMVQVNRLEAFYPPQVLQNVFAKLDRVDFRCDHLDVEA